MTTDQIINAIAACAKVQASNLGITGSNTLKSRAEEIINDCTIELKRRMKNTLTINEKS